MASGEYRCQWHKYLPLAVLNYKTTYHSSIGCEPSKVFHGRIPYNVLDHKLGNNPNEDFLLTTEFQFTRLQPKSFNSGQFKRGHTCRTGPLTQIWHNNYTAIFEIRQSHICTEKAEWETKTTSRPEEN